MTVALRCSVCREPVEDEGLCVACWDLRCSGDANSLRSRRNLARNREIVAAHAAGETGAAIARRFGMPKRTVFRILAKAALA